MNSDHRLRLLLGASTLAVVSSVMGALAYLHRPVAPVGEAILGTAQLIMFETEQCGWCEQFRRKTARDYQRTEFADQAPLRYMSIDDGAPPKRYQLKRFAPFPMLVLFDQYGRELERIEKEPSSSAVVEALVRRNLRKFTKG